jgi:hypothetical protein
VWSCQSSKLPFQFGSYRNRWITSIRCVLVQFWYSSDPQHSLVPGPGSFDQVDSEDSAERKKGCRSTQSRTPACPSKRRLLAGLADHLQARAIQVGVLPFSRRLLHLSFSFFFCLRFIASGTSDGHFVAEVFVQLDVGAVQVPGFTVFVSDGQPARLVTLLQSVAWAFVRSYWRPLNSMV